MGITPWKYPHQCPIYCAESQIPHAIKSAVSWVKVESPYPIPPYQTYFCRAKSHRQTYGAIYLRAGACAIRIYINIFM